MKTHLSSDPQSRPRFERGAFQPLVGPFDQILSLFTAMKTVLMPTVKRLSTAHTLLGVVLLALTGVAQAGTWSYTAWTGDSTSNISSARTAWAQHYGSTSAATVNGVTVTGVSGPTISTSQVDVTGPNNFFTGDTNSLTSLGGTGSGLIGATFLYSVPPVTHNVTLKSLTSGHRYTVSFLSVGFDAPGARTVAFTAGSDTLNVDQGFYGNNNGIRVDYTFTASGTTQAISIAPTGIGSFHIYGIALNASDRLIASDTLGASFAAAGNWNTAAAPASGNNYVTGAFTLKTATGSGNQTFAGDSLTIDSGGSLSIQGSGTITANNLSLNGGSITNGLGSGVATLQGTGMTVAANSTLDGGGSGKTLLIQSAMGGSAGLTIQSSGSTGGVVQFTAANTYTGATAISTGATLNLSGAGNANNSDITLAGTGNLTFTATDGRSFTKAITGSGGNVSFNVAGNTSDSGGGDATSFGMSNTGAFTGTVVVNTGLVSASSNASFGNTANVIQLNAASGQSAGLMGNGLTLASTRAIQLTQAGGNSVFRAFGGSNFQIDGQISGAGNLVKTDGGTLILTSANTYTGTTRVGGGVLQINNALALQNSTLNTSGSGTVTLSSVTTPTLGGLSGSTNLASAITTGYSGVTSLTLNPGTGVSNTYSGVVANGAAGMSLVKTGAGTQVLTGANTFTGNVTVSAGTLEIGGGGSILQSSNASTVSVASGATILISTNAYNVLGWGLIPGGGENWVVAGTINSTSTFAQTIPTGGITLNGGTLTSNFSDATYGSYFVNSDSGIITANGTGNLIGGVSVGIGDTSVRLSTPLVGDALTVSATLRVGGLTAPNGGLTKSGLGTVTLTGTNTYNSTTNITAGTLQLGNGGTTGSLSSSSAITNNGTLAFNRSNTVTQGTDFASVISGSGAVTQAGSGTVVLNGTNTYTGATTINSGGTLQIGAGSTTGALSTSSAITNNGTLSFNRSNTITQGTNFANVISGSGAVTQAGSGTLVLNGTNTYTGTTTVSSGVLNIQNASALGTTAAGTSVTSGAALEIGNGTTTAAEALTLNGTGISNGGALRSVGGHNTYAGLVTLGSAARINTDVHSLTLSHTGTITGSGFGLTVGGASSTTIASIIGTGTGTLTKDGAGTLTLSGASTFSGGTTISAGTIALGADSTPTSGTVTSGPLGTGALTLSGGTLSNGGSTRTLANAIVATAATTSSLRANSGGNLNLTGNITGSGTLWGYGTSSSAAMELSGDNSGFTGTYINNSTGPTFFTSPSAASASASWDAFTGTGFQVLSSGTYNFGSLSSSGGGSGIVLGAATGVTATYSVGARNSNDGFGGVIADNFTGVTGAGSGSFVKVGSGFYTLYGANTYTGTTTVSAGTLTIGDGGTNGSLSSSSSIITNAALVFDRSNTITQGTDFGTSISGTGTLTKQGAGTLVLNGNNSYAGLTNVGTGAVNIQHANALGTTAGATSITSGAALQIQGGITTAAEALTLRGTGISTTGALRNISGNNNYAGLVTLASASRINSDSGTLTLSHTGTITGFGIGLTVGGAGDTTIASIIGTDSGTLTKDGAGTLTLTGTSTYTGATTVSAGVVNIQNASALGTNAAGTSVASGAALQIQGSITTAAEDLTLNGTGVSSDGALRNISGTNTYAGLLTLGSASRINSDSGTLTLSNSGTITGSGLGLTVGGAGNTTINSIIGTGSGTLTKDGAGTLTLAGANTYTGTTTLSAGTLSVTGSIASSSLTINGGTLMGTGTVGAIQLNSAGAVNLGTGTLSTGNIAITDGQLVFNVGSTSSYGSLSTTGAVNLTNGGSGAQLVLNAINGYTAQVGDTFTLITNDLTEAISGNFAGLTEGQRISNVLGSSLSGQITYVGGTGNDVVLMVVSPPPTVTSVTPSRGSTAGGTSVTITGTNLTGATGVTIGGAAATNVVVTNATTITCTTPAGSAGTGSVVVTTAGGSNAANTLYTYILPSLVSWYRAEGTSTDALGANPGTAQGSLTYAAGKVGQAFNLNGSSAVNCGNNSSLRLSNGTISAWIKTSNAGSSYRGIVAKRGAYGLFLADNVLLVYDWSTPSARSTGVSLNDNQWHHVAFTFQAGVSNGSKIYIDGNLSSSFTWNVFDQGWDLAIGAGDGNGIFQNFTGLIDEARVYSSALSATDIQNSFISDGGTLSAPTVTAISPTSGSTAGGTSVTLTGTNFTGATGVTIGGAAATGVSVVSASSITCTTPAGTAGTASVVVTTAGGSNAANTLFTYNSAPTDIALSSSSIAENNAANATVGTLSTTDADVSDTFTYTLVSGTGSTDNASFTIAGSSLRLTPSANFEVKNSYALRVRSTDAGGAFFEKEFTVTVTNVNEAPTDIVLSSNTLAENVAAGSTVGTFSTTDPDSGNTFTFFTVNGAGNQNNSSFTITGNTLKLNDSPNFEAQNIYFLRVRSPDQNGLFVEKEFTINITNVNEAPTLAAISKSGTEDTTVTFTAADFTGAYNDPESTALSSITVATLPATGTLKLSGSNVTASQVIPAANLGNLTYEPAANENGAKTFTVTASDGSLSSTPATTVTMTLTAVNDAPTDIALSATSIAENNAANATVGTLSTTDVDTSDTFTYTLVSGTGSTDNASFTISGSSLRLTPSANFEVKNSYAVRVRTTDAGSLSFEKAFTISITNVNEAPTVVGVAGKPSGLAAWWKADGNANDSSANLNHGTAQNGAGFTTGRSGQAFSLNGTNQFIQAPHSASLSFSSSFTVESWVYLTNRSNHYMLVTKTSNSLPGNYEVRISHGSGLIDLGLLTPGLFFASSNAAVPLNQWAHVAVVFTAGTGVQFYINGAAAGSASMTGLPSVNSDPVRIGARADGFFLQGQIDDLALYNRALNSTEIAAVSSVSPGLPTGSLSLAENAAAGTSAGTLAGVDPDSGDALTYSLVSGTGDSDNASFTIDGTQMRSAAVFDFETKPSYSVRVRATDAGGLFTEEALTIAITNVNEAPTDFALSTNTLAENNAANATVGTLSTVGDPDAGAAASTSYSIVSGAGDTDNGAFNISGNALRLSGSANFEAKSNYSVRVQANDGANTLAKAFTITITNVIEAPVIASATTANLAPTTATLGGNVTSDGGLAVTERGVVYALTATNSNPQIGGAGVTKVAGTGTTGVFTVNVTGLNASTAYSYAAYVTNADATSYTSAGTFTTTATFVPGTGVTVTYSAVIGGTTPVAITGGGTLALTAPNTYTAPTNVQAGTVSINTVGTGSNAQSLGAGNTVNLGVANTSSGRLVYTGGAGTLDKTINALGNGGDTIQNSGTGLLTLSGTINKTGTTLTLQGGANGITVSGTITGNTGSPNSDLIVDGGTVTLASANTYNGPTYIINGGTLNANAANALPTSVARTAIIMDQSGTGSSTLSLGVSQSALSLTGAGSSAINLNANTLTVGTTSGSTTFAGIISGTGGSLTKDGASTQILSGANTYTGTTTVSAGTLQAGSASTFTNKGDLQMSGSGVFDLGGNAVGFVNASSTSTASTLTNNGATNATLNFSNLTTQINSLIQDGSQALAVSFKNDNSGSNLFKLDSPNTFSGGLTLQDGSAIGFGFGSRLRISNLITTVGSAGSIVSSPFGTGAITIGQANTDRAGILFDVTANNSLANAIVFNTALGNDFQGIRVDASATGLVLSGQITANLANATFSNPTTASTVNLTGRVTGAFGLETTASAISVNLNNAAGTNDYAGNTIIGTGSSILLGRADQVSNGAGKGDVVNSGTFNLNGFSETINGLSGAGTVEGASGTPTLTLGDNNATGNTFSGVIRNTAGTLALTKIGTGTQILSGTNTYTGATTVSAGTLSISGSINSSATLSISGGTLSTTGADKLSNTAAVTVSGGTLTVGGADTVGTLTMSSGTIGGSSTLTATTYGLSGGTVTGNLGTGTINSSGTVALNGTAGATAVNVTAGTLTLGSSNRLADGATVTVSSTGTLALGATSDTVAAVVLTGTGSITSSTGVLTSAAAYDMQAGTASAILGGTAGLIKTTSGTVALSGANTYTGATTVSAGTLTLNNVAGYKTTALSAASGATLSILMPGNATSALAAISDASANAFNSVSAAITGSGLVTLGTTSGPHVVAGGISGTMTTNMSAGGMLDVQSGQWQWGWARGSAATNNGSLNVASGAAYRNSDVAFQFDALTGSGTIGNAYNASAVTLTLGVQGTTNNATYGVSSNTATFSGVITSGEFYNGVTTSALNLVKTGSGTQILSGANTYTGTTTISGGTLQIGAGSTTGSLSTSSSITNNATLAFNRSNTITQGTDFASVISGSGAVTQAGTGTLVLSGTNTYTGATTINSGGTLQIGAGGTTGALSTSSAITNNGTLTFNRSNTVTQGTNFASVISGSGAVTQAGTGTLVLAGTNTYTGATTINSGGTLQLGAGSTTGALSTSSSITNNGTLAFNRSDTITQGTNFNSVISGTGAVTQAGSGTLVLNGTNTYTGATTLSAGTLSVGTIGNGGVAGNLGQASNAATNLVFDGGILQYTGGTATSDRAFTINAGKTASILTSSGLTLAGATGTATNGALTKTGTGTLTLSGANTYTGATTVSTGTLQIGAGGTTGSLSTSSAITTNASLSFNRSNTITQGTDFASVIAGFGQVRQEGSGTLVLNGANIYDGTTVVSSGVLNVQNASALGSTTGGTVVSTGAALQVQGGIAIGAEALNLSGTGVSNDGALRNISGTNSYAGLVTLGSAARINSDLGSLTLSNTGTITGATRALTVGGAGNTTIASIIGTTTGTLTKEGAGTLTLTGANTYTGATTISAGTLQVDGSLASGSTVAIGTAGALSGAGTVSGNATLTGSGTINLTNPGVISGTLGVTGGNWNGAGSVTGLVTSSSGTFTISSGANLTANGNLNITGGTIASGSATSTITGSVSYTSASSSSFGGVIAGSSKTLTLNNAAATLTLSGANTYTGATTVSAGILNIQNATGLGTTAGGTSVSNGATLQLQGGITVGAEALSLNGGAASGQTGALVNVSGTNTYGGAITVAASSSISAASGSVLNLTGGVVKNGTVATFNGGGTINVNTVAISGSSANSDLVIDGTTVNLGVANTYNGPTFIRNSGTLNANVTNALPTANGRTAVTFDGTGTSVLTLGADQSVASLTAAGAATLTLNANTLTVGTSSGSTTFAGGIGGTGGLIKDGASTLILSGTNGYTGATTLSAGNLIISGSIGSSSLTTINSGTLLGTGTVGAIQLNSGGVLTPGGASTAGTLSTGNLAIVDGQLVFNLGGTSSYSQLNTTGSINLTAGGTGAKLVLNAISGYAATLGDSFTLVSNNLTNTISGAFAKGTFGGTNVVTLTGVDYVQGLLGSGYYGRITYNSGAGKDLVLKVVTPVMTVTQSGTGVTAGGTYSFGSVDKLVPAVPLTKTFTIQNTGEVDLMGIVVNSPTGAAASDYSIDLTGTASTLPPGSSTTFTVTFNPSRVGTRVAAIAIDSNDLTNNPFNIILTGEGSVARNVTDGWTVAYAGPDAPGTLRNGMTKAVAVQKSTTSDTAVAVFATGYTSSATGGQDIYTAKYNPVTGALLWAKTFNGAANLNDQGAAIAVDSSGNVVITGYTTKTATDADVYVAKYASADGTLLWQKTYAGAGANLDAGVSVAVDASDNVAVAGYGFSATGGMDFFAARYSADGATTYFERLIDGGSNRTDSASSVAVNSVGDLAVAGYIRNAANNMDFKVMKLDATAGTTLWQYTFNGSSNTDDGAYAVAFNAADEVIATGYARAFNFDLYTVKLSGSGVLVWQRQWNGSFDSSDTAYQLVIDSNSDVIVGGTSYRAAGVQDGYVVKYSGVNGSTVWDRRFNGSAGLQDLITSVAIDKLNNVVATGYSQNAAGNYDVLTAKMLAADGGLLWEQRYDGTAAKDDSGAAVAVSPDGNVFVGGYATEASNTTNFLVKNYQSNTAAVQAAQTITFANPGAQTANVPLTLVASASSGLSVYFTVVSGAAQIDSSSNTLLNFTGSGSVTVRATQSGSAVHAAATPVDQTFTVSKAAQTISFVLPASLNSSAQWPLVGSATSGLAVTYNVQSGPGSITGGVLSFSGAGDVTVRASQAGDGRFNAAVDVDAVVTSQNHTPVVIFDNIAENWRDTYAGSGAGAGNDIALQLSGNNAVAGFVAGYTTTGTGKDLYLVKYLADGTLVWSVTSGNAGDDEALSVVVDGNGDVIVAGYVTGTGRDLYVAKYNGSSGSKIWDYTYNGTGGGNDVGVSLALDGTTNVVVGGYAVGSGTSNDFFAAKLNLTNGALVWASVRNRTGATSDVPAKVVVGTDGSVALAGATNSDAWTVKLAAADGTLVWQVVYNFLNRPDAVRGLGLDAANNVIIAAYSQGSNYDIYTAKYAAQNGTLIWGRRYNSSFNSSDSPWDLAVDEDSNVYVTGASYRAASVRDGMTLKYAGLDGTLLWEGRYNGTSSANDENFTISLDGIGNPVISGYTTNSNGTTDVYLAKHNKGPGTIRWQNTFDGANNKNDSIQKVRVDPNGNVWMAGSATGIDGKLVILVLRNIPTP